MNYSHAFHAGNFADVLKHVVLVRLVEYLKNKEAAFRIIDTHAGIGSYSLTGEIAKRSPEYKDGIGRLLVAQLPQKAVPLLAPYLNVIRELNPGDELTTYPGSPLLVRRLMRAQDRLSALELHPDYAERLAKLFAGDVQVRTIHLDGWLALNAHVPPKEKRGLVLVDPPFEEKGEFDRLIDGLMKAHRKFSGGVYALWYPLKDTRAVHDFISGLRDCGIPKILRAEISVRPASNPPRLHGSGMIVVNPPFTLESELRVLLPALANILGDPGEGRHKLEWLAEEAGDAAAQAAAAAPPRTASARPRAPAIKSRAKTGSTGSSRPRKG